MREAISPGTRLCGILLHPATHTRSPAMHNAAFQALGLDCVYLAFDVPAQSLAAAVAGVRALGLAQVAVSLPHKEEIGKHLDEVDEVARRIGAVNTVTRIGDALVGTNTDWTGAVRALEEQGGVQLEGARAVVLGAGGAARAVVHGLRVRGARVVVLNRSVDRARALQRELGAEGSGGLEELGGIDHSVLVNTTSVGLKGDASPVPAQSLRPGSLVMDAVYEPEQTRLLRDARDRGAQPLTGKWMLVHQAAEQLRIWSGREAPLALMAEAFDRAGRREG